jgi:hypothetical protein
MTTAARTIAISTPTTVPATLVDRVLTLLSGRGEVVVDVDDVIEVVDVNEVMEVVAVLLVLHVPVVAVVVWSSHSAP